MSTTSPALTHPVVAEHLAARTGNVQLRIADAITRFAGSMAFVYLHVLLFAVWMLVLERNPWPTLTLIVSLEAIFLSTFVMIGQNRQAALEQAKANHDYQVQAKHLKHNTDLTESIHALAKQIRDQQEQLQTLLERQSATDK
ncbi:MAG TPA: DUF1003 domain-containing protein [Rugosimonospora sp.]|nr:DUF1003 domain-containing protein [Rugosimonospora sp.]